MVRRRVLDIRPATLPLELPTWRQIQAACFGLIAVLAVITIGLYRGDAWATWVWPWDDARMTYIFLSSITAAAGASILWAVLAREPAALAGISLDGVVIFAIISCALVARIVSADEWRLLPHALLAAFFAGGSAIGARITSRYEVRDGRRTPRAVHVAFILFVGALVLVGSALVAQADDVFPWTLPSRTATLVGGAFLGAASYFVYGLRKGNWANAGGQLAGFLAYDLILMKPYWQTLVGDDGFTGSGGYQSFPGQAPVANQDSVNMTSLGIYTAVISVSALLAIYYLFVRPETRIWQHLGTGPGRAAPD